MTNEEDIAQQIEESISPLVEKPGFMNAKGTLQLILELLRKKQQ